MNRRAGQIRRRGERKWLVTVFLGRDASGKRRYKAKTIHGTKKDADRALRDYQEKREDGLLQQGPRLSVSAFLDRYLKTAVKPRVAPRTYADYVRLYDRYVRPEIGTLYLDSVTPLIVQGLYQTWLDRGASADAVKRIHVVLRPAFKQAVRWRIIAANPCADVEVPRWFKREVRSLDRHEAGRFLRAAVIHSDGLLFEVMLATSMRPGEVLGLRWGDCDLDAGKVAVRQALVRLPDGGWRLEPPKTRKSRRSIPIPDGLAARLSAHRREQAQARLRRGPEWQGHDLVFCGRYGQPLDWHNLSQRAFKEILKTAELPREIRPYDLRHTSASLLLQAGEPVKVVAERLGHSTTTLTLDVYAHVLPGMQEQGDGEPPSAALRRVTVPELVWPSSLLDGGLATDPFNILPPDCWEFASEQEALTVVGFELAKSHGG